jgi:RNA polymerase sigma factor (sigma-70 family)
MRLHVGGLGREACGITGAECMDTQADTITDRLACCLERLAAGEKSARNEILEICDQRMRVLSHRLLGKFAKVRRWDNTDDVAQNAAIRLHRALADTVPDSPRGLMGLMATQIQRELLDLARKHAGPHSWASNHDTNAGQFDRDGVCRVDEAEATDGAEETIPLERWEEFHEAIEGLSGDLREVFRMVWYLGLDREAAAKAMGCSVRTLGRMWAEAREQVGRAMEADGGVGS